MTIDIHAHWGPWFFSMETGSLSLNIELLDRFDISTQVVSAVEAVNYDPASGNAALDRALDQTEDERLLGYVVIDPRDLDTARSDLARLTRPRFVGVKIHSHYTRTPIASPAMQRAIELATDHDLPVLVHTWGADVVDLADVAARVEGSRLIAGHMGADAWRLVPEAASRSDRIWFEPCWSRPEAGRIRWVVDQIGCERLVFGSDATLIDPSVTLGAIDAAHLRPDERAMLLHDNARTLLLPSTPSR